MILTNHSIVLKFVDGLKSTPNITVRYSYAPCGTHSARLTRVPTQIEDKYEVAWG